MWEYFAKQLYGHLRVDFSVSFFVGDAAGRTAGWKSGHEADHSCADRYFAMNSGLKFFTPEQYFLNELATPFENTLHLSSFTKWQESHPLEIPIVLAKNQFASPEIFLLIGPPLCGKSSFFAKYLQSPSWVLILEVNFIHIYWHYNINVLRSVIILTVMFALYCQRTSATL